jgi:hypothetical protein
MKLILPKTFSISLLFIKISFNLRKSKSKNHPCFWFSKQQLETPLQKTQNKQITKSQAGQASLGMLLKNRDVTGFSY